MSTALVESPAAKEGILFSVTEATVLPMVEKYMSLTIAGVDDKDGISAVRAARSEVRKARTTVDKERESAKRYYLEEGRKIDAAAKSLWAALDPVEKHLVDEIERIDAEKQRIIDEKLDRQLEQRLVTVKSLGGVPDQVKAQFTDGVIREMTEVRFSAFCDEMRELNERIAIEAKERAEAEERNRIERERIAAERAELDRLRKADAERQAEEQRKLDAQRAEEEKKLEAARAEQQRIAQEQQKERDRIEAERKRLADEIEAKRQAELRAAEEKRKAEELGALRIANEKARLAMMPHKEKVLAYKNALLAIEAPKLPKSCSAASKIIVDLLSDIENKLTSAAESLK